MVEAADSFFSSDLKDSASLADSLYADFDFADCACLCDSNCLEFLVPFEFVSFDLLRMLDLLALRLRSLMLGVLLRLGA